MRAQCHRNGYRLRLHGDARASLLRAYGDPCASTAPPLRVHGAHTATVRLLHVAASPIRSTYLPALSPGLGSRLIRVPISRILKIGILHKYDVISENIPCGGTNSVFYDQLFSHFCDKIDGLSCTGSDKNVSYRCSWAPITVGLDQAYDVCPSV